MKRLDPVPAPIVSDHAMLRYLEQVAGIDVAMHRRALEALVAEAVGRGASGLVHEGNRYCLTGAFLITIKRVRSRPAFTVVRQPGDEA